MRVEDYLALDRDELHDELARMGFAQRAKFDAQLAMLCAVKSNETIKAKQLPAFTLSDGKILEPKIQNDLSREHLPRAT